MRAYDSESKASSQGRVDQNPARERLTCDLHLTKITICGGGNGAQTLPPIAARNLGCAVDIYAPLDDEAGRLRAGIAAHGGLEANGAVQAKARPHRISADPAEVIPGSEVVVLVLPAFAYEAPLRQIAPYLERGAWVGAIPARGGFDYCAAHRRDDLSQVQGGQ